MSAPISDSDLDEIVASVLESTLADTEQPSTRIIAIASDHRGQELKRALVQFLRGAGYRVLDCESRAPSSDYPDLAEAVALSVARAEAWRGIVIDAAGIGSCMAANKVPGVRAALCYNHATAINSREHNNANVLSLGSALTGEGLALAITKVWLETRFAGGRHAKRVEKITAIEQRYRTQS